MELPTYFTDFLQSIRPTEAQRNDYIDGHTRLRNRLQADDTLKPYIVTTFLQGSYRRSTAVRPYGERRPDVDVVVVTTFARGTVSPDDALAKFKPFLREHYPNKWKTNGRSLGIELSKVDLDLVVTTAPSTEVRSGLALNDDRTIEESSQITTEDWEQREPLFIPDRDTRRWEQTHPLAQMKWTHDKNRRTNGHFVNVVKAIKWWKRLHGSLPKHPKSYPLEHILGDCCPDQIKSVAEGVTRTFEEIGRRYRNHAAQRVVPHLGNRGIPSANVLARVSGPDFATFVTRAAEAAKVARQALDSQDLDESVALWQQLFGIEKFPSSPNGGTKKGSFTPRNAPSTPGSGRFG